MNLLLRSRKVQRFFDKRFKRLEPVLASQNQEANVRAERPRLEWVDAPGLSDASSFYSFHDSAVPTS